MNVRDVLRLLRESLLPHDSPIDAPGKAGEGRRVAAVLILLYPRQGEVFFLLTRRPDTLTRHAGQISLPGGAAEPQDTSPWETALRETREELGIRTGRIRPLGRLPETWVQASQYLVVPFVGWSPVAPLVRPDAREVAEVIEAPLEALLDEATVEEEVWQFRGSHWHVTYYRLGGQQVWGATGRILSDFASRLRRSEREVLPGSIRPIA